MGEILDLDREKAILDIFHQQEIECLKQLTKDVPIATLNFQEIQRNIVVWDDILNKPFHEQYENTRADLIDRIDLGKMRNKCDFSYNKLNRSVKLFKQLKLRADASK